MTGVLLIIICRRLLCVSVVVRCCYSPGNCCVGTKSGRCCCFNQHSEARSANNMPVRVSLEIITTDTACAVSLKHFSFSHGSFFTAGSQHFIRSASSSSLETVHLLIFRYMVFFQLPWLPEHWLRTGGVEKLWLSWSRDVRSLENTPLAPHFRCAKSLV